MSGRPRTAAWSGVLAAGLLVACVGAGTAVAQDIPRRPEDITFPKMRFAAPDPAGYRHVLDGSGVAVYLAPARELPLVEVSFTFAGGGCLDPENRPGLAAIAGEMIRRGGTKSLAPADLDERFDYLAAEVRVTCGERRSEARTAGLSANFDECFALFVEMLRHPRFDAGRLALEKARRLEAMKQRNDRARDLEEREWNALLWGRRHYRGRAVPRAALDAITARDLEAFHRRVFHPGNLIVAVSGDFEPEAMKKKLAAALAGWPAGERPPDAEASAIVPPPGVHHVAKDIPQGRVRIGSRSIRRDDDDYFAMMVMNEILGGGAFTSRITNRVRNDEGLAYHAGSRLLPGVGRDGELRVEFQSKNRTVALALKLVLEEIERIRAKDVTDEELATAKAALIEDLPRRFAGAAKMLEVLVDDEWTGRPAAFWRGYRDAVESVTAGDVRRAASKHLDAAAMTVLIVGSWEEIAAGDLGGRARMAELFGGKVTHLPQRDPLTLEPLGRPGSADSE